MIWRKVWIDIHIENIWIFEYSNIFVTLWFGIIFVFYYTLPALETAASQVDGLKEAVRARLDRWFNQQNWDHLSSPLIPETHSHRHLRPIWAHRHPRPIWAHQHLSPIWNHWYLRAGEPLKFCHVRKQLPRLVGSRLEYGLPIPSLQNSAG